MNPTLLEERSDHRAVLIRKAAIHVPAAIGAFIVSALLFVSLLQGNLGVLIGLTIMGLVSFAVGFEASAAMRDLRKEPTTTRGEALRVWSKGRFLFLGRVYYVLVSGRVFELSREAYGSIEYGDNLEIVHWPHTNVVVTLHLVEAPPESAPGTARDR
ncbi:MAG: hypothetical protein QF664_02645 [Dehalococcoidia bacterium]|jgi:hypothetical protein|nr:hypothetical protein [Dehalococcoidia bacterium]